ncbi:unnamed protein product [Anisakis simplex]|uniref:Phytanoyl-CoA dioxygenase n=1 Tax=Anisakis simplex TaxID=6269 RepID=A0A0M3J9A6_ANISI|nr:unnamed protein product [Anisakis simplex]
MEDTLERRITALEERLGLLPIGTEASFNSSIDFDLPALRQKITDAGCGFILKIPSEDVKKLNDLINQVNIQPEYLTFAEKQRAIEFGYDLMVERARLLEEFEKGFQVSHFRGQ